MPLPQQKCGRRHGQPMSLTLCCRAVRMGASCRRRRRRAEKVERREGVWGGGVGRGREGDGKECNGGEAACCATAWRRVDGAPPAHSLGVCFVLSSVLLEKRISSTHTAFSIFSPHLRQVRRRKTLLARGACAQHIPRLPRTSQAPAPPVHQPDALFRQFKMSMRARRGAGRPGRGPPGRRRGGPHAHFWGGQNCAHVGCAPIAVSGQLAQDRRPGPLPCPCPPRRWLTLAVHVSRAGWARSGPAQKRDRRARPNGLARGAAVCALPERDLFASSDPFQ